MFRLDSAFFPPVPRPRASGNLQVSDLHCIYWEEIGREDGVPLLIVHGGPGGRIAPYYRRLANPDRHRGILFEQRGCGRSTPSGSLEQNTTQHLIEDMERLRQDRGVERWIVVGGSWGSCLALAYAQAHPEAVAGLVVSGVFLARDEDIDWWWEGARQIFPEAFHKRDLMLDESERNEARAAFTRMILDPDPAIHGPAAQTLMLAEFSTLELWPSQLLEDPETLDPQVIAAGRMVIHYDSNNFFLDEDQLLTNAGRLSGIPGEIVAGRSDMCTPPKGAFDLAQVWHGSRLTIVPAAGHRWNDEMLGRDLIAAIGRLTDQYRS